MATIMLVEESTAPEEIKQVYNEVKEYFNLDFVPNAFKAIAHQGPEILRQQWEGLKESEKLLGKEATYLIALAVDITNGCDYCINFDSSVLKQLGYDDKKIEAVVNLISLNSFYNRYVEGLQLETDVTPQTMTGKMAA